MTRPIPRFPTLKRALVSRDNRAFNEGYEDGYEDGYVNAYLVPYLPEDARGLRESLRAIVRATRQKR